MLGLDSETTEAVYGGVSGLTLGLELLCDGLSGHTDADNAETARYVLNVLQLERKLRRNTAMLQAIRGGIEGVIVKMRFFTVKSDDNEQLYSNLAAKLAELYRLTVSTLTPRVIVTGEPGYLANPAIANDARALLLAGIRSAFLWRQLGGNRWQLVFRRSAMTREPAWILQRLNTKKTIFRPR